MTSLLIILGKTKPESRKRKLVWFTFKKISLYDGAQKDTSEINSSWRRKMVNKEVSQFQHYTFRFLSIIIIATVNILRLDNSLDSTTT